VVALLFYLALALLLALEEAGAFLLPGDMALLAAGVHARAEDKILYLIVGWLLGSAGMVVGASVLFYGVGRAKMLGRVLPQRVRDLVVRYGVFGVFLARILPGLRNATVFAAATAPLPYPTFLLGLIPAALLWTGALLLVGWFGSPALLALFGAVHDHRILRVISVLLLLGAAVFLWLRMYLVSREEAVERAPE
jgi:membrane protein DedA with SNARE-associated domain